LGCDAVHLDGYQYCIGSCCLHLEGKWNEINMEMVITIFMVTRTVSLICVATELPTRGILFSATIWDEDGNCNNLHVTVSSAIM
jgi:hypothetical protein